MLSYCLLIRFHLTANTIKGKVSITILFKYCIASILNMDSSSYFKKLPDEIGVSIFRNFFSFDEKVKVLQDNYFWTFLSDSYAWRDKPKISLKTLKGASENLLNEIESGFYGRNNNKTIYKVLKNTKRGVVSLEEFIHKIEYPEPSCKKRKITKKFVPINEVKELFTVLKSRYQFFTYDIFTDKVGLFIFSINAKHIENLELNTLMHIGKTNFFIYKKNRYFVLIEGKGDYSNMNSFSQADLSSNSELVLLLLRIANSNCNKIMKTKNFIACKMIPWKKKFKCTRKSTFNYMLRKKMIKVTTKIK